MYKQYLDELSVEKDLSAFGYVYITLNTENGKLYIGQHKICKLCLVDKCPYIGSGKTFLKALKKYGKDSFYSVCIKNCDSQESLNIYEESQVRGHQEKFVLYNIKICDNRSSSSNNLSRLTKMSHLRRWEKEGLVKKFEEEVSSEILTDHHIEGYQVYSIAGRYGFPTAMVRDRILELGLPCYPFLREDHKYMIDCEKSHALENKTFPLYTDRDLLSMFSKEEVSKLYVDQKMSDKEAGIYLGISEKYFSRLRGKIYNIKRTRESHLKYKESDFRKLASKSDLIEVFINQNKTRREVCQDLGIQNKTLTKLLKHYGIQKERSLVAISGEPTSPKQDTKTRLEKHIDFSTAMYLYNQGFTVKTMSTKLNTNRDVISDFLKLKNLKRNPEIFENSYKQIGKIATEEDLLKLLESSSSKNEAVKRSGLKYTTFSKLLKYRQEETNNE